MKNSIERFQIKLKVGISSRGKTKCKLNVNNKSYHVVLKIVTVAEED